MNMTAQPVYELQVEGVQFVSKASRVYMFFKPKEVISGEPFMVKKEIFEWIRSGHIKVKNGDCLRIFGVMPLVEQESMHGLQNVCMQHA
jgi:hypothetical protein